jgi:hypothetical protein
VSVPSTASIQPTGRMRVDVRDARRAVGAAAAALAEAIATEVGRPISYRHVETDAAARAAHLITELLWPPA